MDRMPPKRKAASSTGGFAKKKKSSGSAKLKYGGTGKKNADKYGAKGIDWDAAVKLAERAAKKEINKNIETQYSQVMMTSTKDPAKTLTKGWDLRWLNADAANAKMVQSNALIFNLGYLSAQGSSLQTGHRIGQRMNAKYFRIVVSANLPMVTSDCVYHWRIVRRKHDQAGQLAYDQPTIAQMSEVGLFKPVSDGPLFKDSSYGYGTDTIPFPTYVSSMRQNTEAWTFTKGAYGSKYVKAQPLDLEADHKYTASFCETFYHPLEEEWEFSSRTGSDLKGGNYFFVMWREGAPDYVQFNAAQETIAKLGGLEIKVLFELAFKDGG